MVAVTMYSNENSLSWYEDHVALYNDDATDRAVI